MKSEVFDCICLGYGCAVEMHWWAMPSPESESYVCGLWLVDLQSPLPGPVFNTSQVILKFGRSKGRIWVGCSYSSVFCKGAKDCFSDWGISAVYSVYSSGPKMLPWGTPYSIGNGGEVSLWYVVSKYLLLKYDFMRLNSRGRVCLILSRRPWCHTLSNAWLTSKEMAEQMAVLCLLYLWVGVIVEE